VAPVTLYWRPMCGYCEILKRGLTKKGVAYEAVDIWDDRDKAEIVRQATGGDEIVPTVQIGDRFLVNPSADDVVEAAQAA
jgi:mycoredoxin